MKPLACGRYHELLSARLDGLLTVEEERGLEDHLALCPACRAVGSRLAAIQTAFDDLEEVQAPEGFAQGVMDRIRAEGKPKVLPLFKRPQVRALAGLAACLVLVFGLYGTSHKQEPGDMMLKARGVQRDAAAEDGEEPGANAALVGPDSEDVPQVAAYAAPEAQGLEKAVPDPPVDTERTLVPPEADVALILDRLPDGAAELIPSGVTVSHDVESSADVYTWLTAEELAAIEALAFEQGLLPGTTEGAPQPERCALIIRNQ